METISSFRGKHAFLSNFSNYPARFEDTDYPTAENAFQAAKTLNPVVRERFTEITPSEAKRLGRSVPLRQDWNRIRISVMTGIVRDKFTRNPELKRLLLATGDAILIEGNTWGDRFWGVDERTGKGENHLGLILMDIRKELKNA